MSDAERLSSFLYPLLRAWTDDEDIGDAEFDLLAGVQEFCDFLAHKILASGNDAVLTPAMIDAGAGAADDFLFKLNPSAPPLGPLAKLLAQRVLEAAMARG